ncbi:hypothetical protein [Faecalibaculum rodentium]|uniref:hypothetical protein n=1 Tax=Faecalibaculum rodentium TaxID=1702221 RepID=UPI001F56A602|nr:hypothetical protein [Faecalibaculum rodentium]
MGLFNKKELARIAELERENEILKATLSKTKGLSVAQEEKYLQRLKEQNQEERKAIMELKIISCYNPYIKAPASLRTPDVQKPPRSV